MIFTLYWVAGAQSTHVCPLENSNFVSWTWIFSLHESKMNILILKIPGHLRESMSQKSISCFPTHMCLEEVGLRGEYKEIDTMTPNIN